MELSYEIKENVGVLKIGGIIDYYNATELKEAIAKCTEETVNLVFDLGTLLSFGCEGLGVVVACLKNLSEIDGDIRLANVQGGIRQVFEITRAWKIFEIFDDVDEAVKSYQND